MSNVYKGRGYVYSIQYHIVWCVQKIQNNKLKIISKAKSRNEVKIVEKAYKFRIYPSIHQEELIQKTFGCCRFVYNTYLSKRIELYKQDSSTMNYNACRKDLKNLKQEFEWLKEVDSISIQSSLKDLDKFLSQG